MKKWCVLLFILATWTAFGQKEYIVKGKVRNAAPNATLQLWVLHGNTGDLVGTDSLRDGRFLFRGTLEESPARMSIVVEGDSSFYGERTLWIGEPVTKIRANGSCVELWKVKSSLKQQREENWFVKNTAHITREYALLRNQREPEWLAEYYDQQSETPKMKQYPVTRMYDSLSALQLKANLKALEKQKVLSEVAMERLYPLGREIHYSKHPRIAREIVEKFYLRLDPALKNTARANEIHTYLYPVKIIGIGEPMAEATLFDREGKKHQLSEYKGKYILLDFWSSSCGPCIMAQPELEEVMEKYDDKVNVIGVSLDVSEKVWKKAIEKLKGIQLNDFKGEGGLITQYGFEVIPKFVIISPEGKVLDKWFGYWKGVFEDRLMKQWKNNGNEDK